MKETLGRAFAGSPAQTGGTQAAVTARLGAAAGRLEPAVGFLCLGYTLLCQFATNSLQATIGDPTLFAYGGRLIVNGAIPYRDFWDNKPPLIFYIEALGYRLIGPTWVAPTIVQAAVTLATVIAFIWLSKRLLPGDGIRRIAFLVLVTLGMNLPIFIMDGSNLTETYLLLPVAVCIGLLDPFADRPSRARWCAAGAVAALAFLLRPNGAALGAVALLVLVIRGYVHAPWSGRARLGLLLSFTAGGLIPLALSTLYFARYGVAGEMWFATLGYNVTAYDELFLKRPSLFDAKRLFMLKKRYGVAPMYLAGAAAAGLLLLRYRRLPAALARKRAAVLVLGLGWALSEVALVVITGHPYAHYVLMLVPSAAYLAANLFDPALWQWARGRGSAVVEASVRVAALGYMVVIWAPLASAMPSEVLSGIARVASPFPTADQQVAIWARHVVGDTDPVMTLGHWHGHMMYLGNPPAVPVLSTFHLKSTYGTERWGPRYVEVLTHDPPKVVVITDPYWDPFVDRRGETIRRPCGMVRKQVTPLLREKYRRVRHPFRDGRQVFLRKDVPSPRAVDAFIPSPDSPRLF